MLVDRVSQPTLPIDVALLAFLSSNFVSFASQGQEQKVRFDGRFFKLIFVAGLVGSLLTNGTWSGV